MRCGRILEAYQTGHGQLTVRGKVFIEQLDRSARSSLIISEVGTVTNRLFQKVLTCFIVYSPSTPSAFSKLV